MKLKVGKTELAKMKAQLLNEASNKFSQRRICQSGGIRIPAVSEYTHIKQEFNSLLLSIGIKYRMKSKLKYNLHKINFMNRYMKYQILRLIANRRNPKLFGTIAISCMESSISFRMSAIHKIYPSGHTTMAMKEVMAINRKVTNIIKNWNPVLKYRRIYIPKGESTGRPLGVPTKEWRLVLHMGQNMLQIYLGDHLLKTQHGFIPGRGTLSAGRDILRKVINSNYIYECDLKQFFPSVNIKTISETLLRYNVPEPIVDYLELINSNAPELPEEELLDESIYKLRQQANAEMTEEEGEITKKMKEQYDDFYRIEGLQSEGIKRGVEQQCEGMSNSYNPMELRTIRLYPDSIGKLFQGVPQGAPTSPLLSILILKDFLSNQKTGYSNPVNSISYADDPIFYSDEGFKIKDQPAEGIILNPEKSDGVKYNGKGLKPLKYLGLTYDGIENTLTGTTRKGTVSVIPEALKTLGESISYNKEDHYLVDIARKNFFGFIQACLYTNNWGNLVKGVTNEYIKDRNEKVHPRSLLGKGAKSNLTSTIAMNHLYEVFKYEKLRQKKRRLDWTRYREREKYEKWAGRS